MGDRYILLVGAEHANVFGNATPSALHAELPEDERKILAMRMAERMNIMAGAARIGGPEASGYASGMALASCIQLGSFNCMRNGASAREVMEVILQSCIYFAMPPMLKALKIFVQIMEEDGRSAKIGNPPKRVEDSAPSKMGNSPKRASERSQPLHLAANM